jgi:hypothetical protein
MIPEFLHSSSTVHFFGLQTVRQAVGMLLIAGQDATVPHFEALLQNTTLRQKYSFQKESTQNKVPILESRTEEKHFHNNACCYEY